LKQVYPELDPFAKPERDFRAELDDLCRMKVAELVQAYIEVEVDERLGRLRYQRSDGRSVGFRDGHDPERTVISTIGPIPIRRPRVRGVQHESELIPKFRRRLPSIDKTIHQLWIEGLAHCEFEPTLRGLLGSEAPLSASMIARVNAEFGAEFDAWKRRRLDSEHFVLPVGRWHPSWCRSSRRTTRVARPNRRRCPWRQAFARSRRGHEGKRVELDRALRRPQTARPP